MRCVGLVVWAALVAARVDAGVEVRAEAGRVTVHAAGASLGDVLDRLAAQTGMTITWEKNLGRPNVTAKVVDRTPAEAVASLLEGTGLNYALRLDATGTRVETLMILGFAGPPPPPDRFVPRKDESNPGTPVGEPVQIEGLAEPETSEPPTAEEAPLDEPPGVPSPPAPAQPPR